MCRTFALYGSQGVVSFQIFTQEISGFITVHLKRSKPDVIAQRRISFIKEYKSVTHVV